MHKKTMGLFFILTLAIPSFAGWVITEKVLNTDLDEIGSSAVMIQDNKVKSVEDEITTVFDLDKEIITFLKPETKSYWQGTAHEYQEELKKAIKIQMEKDIAVVPEELKSRYQSMYEDLLKTLEEKDQQTSLQKVDVEAKKTNEKSFLLGYPVEKYQLWQGTILKEDVWISKGMSIVDEFDLDKFSDFMNEIIKDVDQVAYQASSEYLALMKRGYALKTIEYGFGYKIIREVSSIEEKNIPSEEFLPPADYKKVSIADLELSKRTEMDAEDYREY